MTGDTVRRAFKLLEQRKIEIEQQLGPLVWHQTPNGKDCKIIHFRGVDIANQVLWPEAYGWLKHEAEHFQSVFSPLVKALPVLTTSKLNGAEDLETMSED
jgi:hypothetical protein